jgi:hypothetical protein
MITVDAIINLWQNNWVVMIIQATFLSLLLMEFYFFYFVKKYPRKRGQGLWAYTVEHKFMALFLGLFSLGLLILLPVIIESIIILVIAYILVLAFISGALVLFGIIYNFLKFNVEIAEKYGRVENDAEYKKRMREEAYELKEAKKEAKNIKKNNKKIKSIWKKKIKIF